MVGTSEERNKNRIEKAVAFLSGLNMNEETIGTHNVNDWFFYSVKEYETVSATEVRYESHRKHVDIQWIVSGEEEIQYIADAFLSEKEAYDELNDVTFFNGNRYSSRQKLVSGCYAVIMPNEAHKPGIRVNESCIVKKIVGKVLLD